MDGIRAHEERVQRASQGDMATCFLEGLDPGPMQSERLRTQADAGRPTFEVHMTNEAIYGLAVVVPQDVYDRISFLIGNLRAFPYYGGKYQPYYQAAMPDVATSIFYCGHYGVYYTVDEGRQAVIVLAVEDERMNPLGRFPPLVNN